jgi:hypothetical protein
MARRCRAHQPGGAVTRGIAPNTIEQNFREAPVSTLELINDLARIGWLLRTGQLALSRWTS